LALLPALNAAAAEESGRVVKIGILALDDGAGTGIRRRLQSLGWVERKTSFSTIGMPAETLRGFPRLPRRWCERSRM
jgi:hypothetical protein